MTKPDLSIVIPGIRTKNWEKLIKSAQKSCKKYKYEFFFVSPFELPKEIKDDNVHLIKDFGSIPRCVQKTIPQVNSDLFFLTVDDRSFCRRCIRFSR